MDELTFVIPVRIDSQYRLRNLLAMIKFYSNIGVKFIILEASASPSLFHYINMDSSMFRYVHVNDYAMIFHRTKYINQMLWLTDTRFAAIWDTDAIVPVNQIKKAYQLLRSDGNVMVYPYDGTFWSVNDIYSEVFCKHGDLRILTDFPQPKVLMNGYHSVGGAFIVNVSKYKDYGWENENFIGWGPEDAERYHRLEILGQKPLRVEGSLYHLYHTRGVNSGDFDYSTALSTKKEYCKVCAMTRKELSDYINTWHWIR